eukprot:1710221-Amphidinium_carterae.2
MAAALLLAPKESNEEHKMYELDAGTQHDITVMNLGMESFKLLALPHAVATQATSLAPRLVTQGSVAR